MTVAGRGRGTPAERSLRWTPASQIPRRTTTLALRPMPIVTISRQYGSGGSEVAARVAGALGWSLLDNAIVDAVAEQLGTSRAAVVAREERVPSLVERLASAMTLGTPEFVPVMEAATPGPLEDRIVEVTRRVVQSAAAAGPVVVVGRGAQSMLAERRDALHVFCYASSASRAARGSPPPRPSGSWTTPTGSASTTSAATGTAPGPPTSTITSASTPPGSGSSRRQTS